MTTFIAVCIGIIAVELGVLCAALLVTVFQIKQAAKAFEVLVYRLEEQVQDFTETMHSSWMKVLQAGAAVAGTLWKKDKE